MNMNIIIHSIYNHDNIHFYKHKKMFFIFILLGGFGSREVMFQYQMKISKWWFHKVEYFRCIVEIVWPVTVYFLSLPECFLESNRNRLLRNMIHRLSSQSSWTLEDGDLVLYFKSMFLLSFSAFFSPLSPCLPQLKEER